MGYICDQPTGQHCGTFSKDLMSWFNHWLPDYQDILPHQNTCWTPHGFLLSETLIHSYPLHHGVSLLSLGRTMWFMSQIVGCTYSTEIMSKQKCLWHWFFIVPWYHVEKGIRGGKPGAPPTPCKDLICSPLNPNHKTKNKILYEVVLTWGERLDVNHCSESVSPILLRGVQLPLHNDPSFIKKSDPLWLVMLRSHWTVPTIGGPKLGMYK